MLISFHLPCSARALTPADESLGPLTPDFRLGSDKGKQQPKMRGQQERETGVFPPHFLLGLATLFSFVYLGGGCSPRLNHLPDSLVFIFLFSLGSLTILSFFNLFRSWVVLTSCCVESSVPQHPSLIYLPPFPQLCGKLLHYNALTQTL